MAERRKTLLPLLILALVGISVWATVDQTSVPGRALRWCLGEPLAEQDVNDAANWLVVGNRGRELEEIALALMTSASANTETLPQYRSFDAKELPPEAVPATYWHLGGTFSAPPEVVLWKSPDSTSLELRWGHGRQMVIVYRVPPDSPPQGFAVRKITARTFVVAN